MANEKEFEALQHTVSNMLEALKLQEVQLRDERQHLESQVEKLESQASSLVVLIKRLSVQKNQIDQQLERMRSQGEHLSVQLDQMHALRHQLGGGLTTELEGRVVHDGAKALALSLATTRKTDTLH